MNNTALVPQTEAPSTLGQHSLQNEEMLWVPTCHQTLLFIFHSFFLNTRSPPRPPQKAKWETLLPSGKASHLATSSNVSAAAEAQAWPLLHCVRGYGWYKAQPEVLSQLSSWHKPDQQLSEPPSLPLRVDAPSPLPCFNLNSLVGWQFGAPNECCYFLPQTHPCLHTRGVMSPFLHFLLHTWNPTDSFFYWILATGKEGRRHFFKEICLPARWW